MKKIKFIALILTATLMSRGIVYAQKSTQEIKQLAVKAPTQFATINNQKIAYRKFGKGTPIILATRFRGSLDLWDPLFLDLLAQHNTVITFDFAGTGYSEGTLPSDIKDVAAEITQLADYLKIDKFNLLGWSYGGLAAEIVTFNNPSRVLKTILIGSNPPGKNQIAAKPAFLETSVKPKLGFEDEVILFFEPTSDISKSAAQASHDRIAQRLDESKVPSSQEVFQRYVAGIGSFSEDKANYRSAFATLKTPVLVISGDHDIALPLDNWFPLIGKAPTMQILVWPDAGHAPHHQNPQIIVGYITNFLNN